MEKTKKCHFLVYVPMLRNIPMLHEKFQEFLTLKLSPRPLIPVGVATVQEPSVRAASRHFNEFRPEISPVGKWCKDGPRRYCWGPIIPINQVKCQ